MNLLLQTRRAIATHGFDWEGVKRRLIQTDVTQHRFSEHSCETLAQFPSAIMKHLRPQVSFSIPVYSVDANYALANVLDQRPPYELSRLSNTYVLPKAQSKAQDRCFLRTSFEDLMRSDAASKFANETRSCKTRSTTARPCLLSINTPCDHISASGTSSTHARAVGSWWASLEGQAELPRCDRLL